MKKILSGIAIASIAILSTTATISCGGGEKKNTENVSVSENAEMSFALEGMKCAKGCAGSIEKMLMETTGITAAKVDYEKKMGTVKYDDRVITESGILALFSEFKDGKYGASLMDAGTLEGALNGISSTVNQATKKVSETTEAVKKGTTDMVEKGKETVNNTKEKASKFVKEVKTETVEATTKAGNSIKATADRTKQTVKESATKVKSTATEVSNKVSNKVSNTAETIKEETTETVKGTTRSAKRTFNNVKKGGQEMMNGTK